jgi:hypothetical protein
LLDKLKNEVKLDKNSLQSHSFSNVGCSIFYQHLIKQMDRIEELGENECFSFLAKNLKGAIFDCAPDFTNLYDTW